VASATAVTAVGAVVGVASGSEAKPVQAADIAGATLLADVPSATDAQAISDNIGQQATAQQQQADAAAKQAAAEAARVKAAADAQAKADADKAAADAAAKAQQQAQEAANRAKARSQLAVTSSSDNSAPTITASPGSVQAIAQGIIGDPTQFQCFSNIVTRESGWNYTAVNPSSGSYGLVQALPGSKMASAGADWRTNPATQIKWGLGYMNDRYGSPCGAWSFWQAHSWY
jgi:hypothetical protein